MALGFIDPSIFGPPAASPLGGGGGGSPAFGRTNAGNERAAGTTGGFGPVGAGGGGGFNLQGAAGGAAAGGGIGAQIAAFINNQRTDRILDRENRTSAHTTSVLLSRLLGVPAPNQVFRSGGGSSSNIFNRGSGQFDRADAFGVNPFSDSVDRATGSSLDDDSPPILQNDPRLRNFQVQEGSVESRFLPVGAILPGATLLDGGAQPFGLSEGVFNARRAIFGALSDSAIDEGDTNRLASLANAGAAQQAFAPQARTAQGIGALGNLGSTGFAGSQSRINSAQFNRNFQLAANSQGLNFLTSLFGQARSTF